jgi:predicted helicase
LDYETIELWKQKWIENPDVPLSYRVEIMKLDKPKTQPRLAPPLAGGGPAASGGAKPNRPADDTAFVIVNESLTLAGVPLEVFDYRLGNRSALEWVIDQYQVSTDKRSGITSDPNRADDPEYIVRLVGQVVRVSVQTVQIVNALPTQFSDSRISEDEIATPGQSAAPPRIPASKSAGAAAHVAPVKSKPKKIPPAR